MLKTATTLDAAATRAKQGGAKVASEKVAGWVQALSVLFFMSGFPALIYQLVWQRALFRIFGVNIESVTIVVTAFMVGLGLGSLAGGWLSQRRGLKLLPLLAVIEGLTALFGMFSLPMFESVGAMTLGLPLPVTAAVTLALVLVPTLLMGATLPVLVAEVSRHFSNTGRSMGLLYYTNTLGAGAGCLVALAMLFPFLGSFGSICVAVALNLLVAAGAMTVHVLGLMDGPAGKPANAATPAARAAAKAPAAPSLAFMPMLGLAALGGFVSLSYEIFFFRIASFSSGSSATAFAMTLCAFLIGIASGSRRAGEIAEQNDPKAASAEVLTALLLACALGLFLLPVLGIASLLPGLGEGVLLIGVFALARAWGMLLPYLAHRGIAADDEAGPQVSYLYLANIAGSAAGSLLTGFVLMNYLSLVQIGQLLVVAGFAGVALVWWTAPGERTGTPRELGLLCASAVLAVAFMPWLAPNLLERLQFGTDGGVHTFKRVIENRSGVLAVSSDDKVWGNGMYDGAFNTDLAHDANGIARPYALSLFHAAPKRVLMIGLATGSWARVIASNPNVESLTIVEINPGYLQLIAERPEVSSVLTDPKVKIVLDDGRRWLRLNPDAKFDAVVSNTTWYFRGNVTNLLSTEFIELVSKHLEPKGIFFYNTTSSPRVQRTACLASPHSLRYTNHMLFTKEQAALDFDRWRQTLTAYTIGGKPVLDLASNDHKAALDRLMGFKDQYAARGGDTAAKSMETCGEILARTEGMAPFTDDNMGSEWRRMFGLN